MLGDMSIRRMDHIGVVVDDLAAAIAFFVELGGAHVQDANRGPGVVAERVGEEGRGHRPILATVDQIGDD